MPESVTDRPTKSHEYLFLLTIRELTGKEADNLELTIEELEERIVPGREFN